MDALLRRISLADLLEFELEVRNDALDPDFMQDACDLQIGRIQAELRRRGVIRGDGENRLVFDEVLERVAEDAQLVLSEQLRHSILQVVHG